MLTKDQRLARLLRQPIPAVVEDDGREPAILQETGEASDIILTEDGDTIIFED